MSGGQLFLLFVQVLFLASIGLCVWKRLWTALGVLLAVIVASNILLFREATQPLELLLALISPGGVAFLLGTFVVFPLTVYFNLQARERQERRSTIRRSRRHTGRE